MKSANYQAMIYALKQQVDAAAAISIEALKEINHQEAKDYIKQHPAAHMVIGDFEIRCLNPEKYNL